MMYLNIGILLAFFIFFIGVALPLMKWSRRILIDNEYADGIDRYWLRRIESGIPRDKVEDTFFAYVVWCMIILLIASIVTLGWPLFILYGLGYLAFSKFYVEKDNN